MSKSGLFSRFTARPIAGYAAVFFISAAFFAYLQWQAGFADPDSFYHMKMTLLTAAHGPVREFPWLPLTVLRDGYADQALLYHILLIPFFLLAGPLIGIKIATVMLAAGAVVAFYGLLRAFDLGRVAFWMSLLLASCGGFFFRINLDKTPALTVIWFLLELIAIRRRRYLMLFLLAFGHVWLHGSWPLALAAVALYLVAGWMTEAINGRGKGAALVALKKIWTEQGKSLAAVLGGLAAGLVINPFFPANLKFYWEQLVQIAVINYGSRLDVGSEWLPYVPTDLFRQVPTLLVVPALALIAMLLLRGRTKIGDRAEVSQSQAAAAIFACLLTALFALMTLRQRRQIEFLAPALALFDAVLLAIGFSLIPTKTILANLQAMINGRFQSPRMIAVTLLVVFAATLGNDISTTREAYANIPWQEYRPVSEWIRSNVAEGELLVNTRWDDFPMLFFQDDGRRWLSGLDPTFSYRADPDRWQRLQDIRDDKEGASASGFLRSVDSHYLFSRRGDGIPTVISHDPDLKLAYQDQEAVIFQLK